MLKQHSSIFDTKKTEDNNLIFKNNMLTDHVFSLGS